MFLVISYNVRWVCSDSSKMEVIFLFYESHYKEKEIQCRHGSSVTYLFVLLRQDPMKRDYGDVRILQAFFLSHCYNKDCLYAILPEVYLLNQLFAASSISWCMFLYKMKKIVFGVVYKVIFSGCKESKFFQFVYQVINLDLLIQKAFSTLFSISGKKLWRHKILFFRVHEPK